MRARPTRARKSHTYSYHRLIYLSMIVGGRVWALFIRRLLSFCFRDTNRFLYLSSRMHGRLNEWKELGKNGQRGFEYGEFWLARASFSPFLCSFLCRRVIAYLLSSSSKKKSTTTLHGGKSIFWERIPTFHLKRILVPVGEFVSIKIESSLLFFWIAETTQRLSSIHLRCSAYHDTRLSWDRSKKLW